MNNAVSDQLLQEWIEKAEKFVFIFKTGNHLIGRIQDYDDTTIIIENTVVNKHFRNEVIVFRNSLEAICPVVSEEEKGKHI